MITEVRGESAETFARTSRPLISSIQMSRTTSGTGVVCTYSKKLLGLEKARTANPSETSNRPIDLSTAGSSSTRQTISSLGCSLDGMGRARSFSGNRQTRLSREGGYWTLVPFDNSAGETPASWEKRTKSATEVTASLDRK